MTDHKQQFLEAHAPGFLRTYRWCDWIAWRKSWRYYADANGLDEDMPILSADDILSAYQRVMLGNA